MYKMYTILEVLYIKCNFVHSLKVWTLWIPYFVCPRFTCETPKIPKNITFFARVPWEHLDCHDTTHLGIETLEVSFGSK